jgi:hypothetical protein
MPQPVSAPPALDGSQAGNTYIAHLDTDLHLAKLGVGSQRFSQPDELEGPEPRSLPAEHVQAVSRGQRSMTTLAQAATPDPDRVAVPRRSSDVMGGLPSPEYNYGRWNASGSDFNAADAASGAGTNKPRLVRF